MKRVAFLNNQSCTACHVEDYGYTGPKNKINIHREVQPESIADVFENRKPTKSAYGGESPIFYFDRPGEVNEQVWFGKDEPVNGYKAIYVMVGRSKRSSCLF